jgi:predicted O-linked N-acetylglucosamine transferase (SPINDLY family)
MTDKFREVSTIWRPTIGLSDGEMVDQVRADRIDILIDLSGHTSGNRLGVFARRAAPIQVTGWGHVGGTGIPSMDYWLADPIVAPVELRHELTESVHDLPCVITLPLPDYAPEVGSLPAIRGAPIAFGCFNRIQKISNAILAIWARVFSALPDARLILKDRPLDGDHTRRIILERLHDHGIAEERVTLLGRTSHVDHLRAFHQVDIALDPFPYCGGTSSLEALWMGVPVLTLRGDTSASRVTESILSVLGMDGDWVAEGSDDYVDQARARANDMRRLAQLRANLRSMMADSPVGNPTLYVSAIESAYRTVWRRWCGSQSCRAG